MDLHDFSGCSCRPTEEQEYQWKNQSSRDPCSGVATLQQGRPFDGRPEDGPAQAPSHYLRDLCPQADHIRSTGPVVAAGEIVLISSPRFFLWFKIGDPVGPSLLQEGGPDPHWGSAEFLSVGAS